MVAGKRIGIGAAGVVALAALVWALLPDPVAVDLVAITVAPMEVTVAAEGTTRVRDPWTVTAPLTGTVARSPVQVGDAVRAAETVVAVIEPAQPAFLDARSRRQAEIAVTEAQAAVRLAEVNLNRASADHSYAVGQLARNRTLAARGIISQRLLEDSAQAEATASAALTSAEYEVQLHRATLARTEAQLQGPEAGADAADDACCLRLTAPLNGTVLQIEALDARLVQAGSPLLTIGDLADLGIETDLLSSDAVKVSVGAEAHVERWGGAGVIAAKVRRIDPAGFTRVSALGIEEQRVKVLLDILTPPEARAGLGDRFRVFVRIVVWSDDAVLQVPQSALFRDQGGWAVFRAVAGKAVLTKVEIGQQRDDVAQVIAGLEAGAQVVAYPGSGVVDGASIAERSTD
ncbi:efflux RND transporter periplasmic adaptor subunit [Rhodobacter ferrooxidans]|uniref:Efflux transporter, RND family, MFP subunit n=1 Tax=Rhodobacter ferrooxidans TaxID=371731 RepID=C8RZP2_9RHOB|nr:HlyD family efflux transporter periplasmic adaptor subunit [Rhodobacter sp. SW2]EEW25839.1 efflux transporter, RND family, MFP subunit [Rhodobacter sp. SW2]